MNTLKNICCHGEIMLALSTPARDGHQISHLVCKMESSAATDRA